MSQQTLYGLKDSTAVEPLVNRWVAWSHVVAPVACSLHLSNYQLELLRAYLKNPAVHARACEDPQLRSGRFVDIAAERAGEVEAFLRETEARQGHNLKLAHRLMEFYNRLVTEARGHSLEPFYKILPPELQGYVELLYDYYHRPSLRFLESLVYESDYYDESLQSFRLFRLAHDSSRPFFMSTPRLPADSDIEWNASFASTKVDELFRLDTSPRPLCEIRELLGLDAAADELLSTLLTDEPARPQQTWRGETVRVRYFGHACVLVEYNGVSILTDPCLGVVPGDGGAERFSYRDLPEHIDYALITHNHHDHYALETLLRLRHRLGCLVVPRSFGISYGDLSLKLLSRKIGFEKVVELDTLESIPFPGGEIIGVPFLGEHADLPHGKTGYVIRAGSEQMLFAADSDCLDKQVYVNLRHAIGTIQTLFIGMECVGAPLSWSCGPFLPAQPEHSIDQSRRYKGSDSRRALEILDAVGAERLYVYAMGMEPWFEHLLGLAYTEDATQLKEAKRLLQDAPRQGIAEQRLLFGKDEFHLTVSGTHVQVAARPRPTRADVSLSAQGTRKLDGQRTVLDAHLEYWKKQLRAPLPFLDLPTDHPRAPGNSYRGAAVRSQLSGELANALRALSLAEEATLSMTLLAAFKTLLHRYTGQTDLIVGSPFTADGERIEGETAAGRRANTLALRTDVSGNPSFAELLRRVKEVVLDAHAHGDAPYDRILHALRGGGDEALFRVWFEVQSGQEAETEHASPSGANDAERRVDMSLVVKDGGGELNCTFEYDASLFDAATVQTFAGHYRNLIEQVAAGNASRGVLDIPLNAGDEKAGGVTAHSETDEDEFAFD